MILPVTLHRCNPLDLPCLACGGTKIMGKKSNNMSAFDLEPTPSQPLEIPGHSQQQKNDRRTLNYTHNYTNCKHRSGPRGGFTRQAAAYD